MNERKRLTVVIFASRVFMEWATSRLIFDLEDNYDPTDLAGPGTASTSRCTRHTLQAVEGRNVIEGHIGPPLVAVRTL